jgi:hypothetical protein
MRLLKSIIIIAILSLPLSAYAWGVVGMSGGITGGTSHLVDEDFEGTGTPAGWTLSAGVSADYSVSPLRGSHSLEIDVDYDAASTTFPNQNEAWGHFLFRMNALPVSNYQFFQARNDTTVIAYIGVTSAGALSCGQGTQQSSYGSSLSVDTIYHIWWHYINNGTMEMWIGTTTTRPGTTDCRLTNGTSTDAVNDIRFRAVNHDIYIDQVLVDDASIAGVDL